MLQKMFVFDLFLILFVTGIFDMYECSVPVFTFSTLFFTLIKKIHIYIFIFLHSQDYKSSTSVLGKSLYTLDIKSLILRKKNLINFGIYALTRLVFPIL